MDQDDDLYEGRDILLERNPDYARREKMFRMCAGCGSDPLRYRDGIIEIEIRLSDRTLADPVKSTNVIRQIMGNWKGVVPGAKGLRAHLYRTGKAEMGFTKPTAKFRDEFGQLDRETLRDELAKWIQRAMSAERVDLKIGERFCDLSGDSAGDSNESN